MSEWKTVRLGELFELQMGKTPDRKRLDYFGDNGNKWISIADISKADKYITETKECITDEAVNNSGIKQIPANTLIMSFKLSIGKTAITTEPMYSNEAIMAFLPNGKYETDNDFLYHLFSNKDWSEGSNKAVKGITLNKASLSEAKIPLPPLETQKHIAAVLNKCTALIAKHREMLTKYDTLIKSRFIEMFGDPVINERKWEKVRLDSVADIKIGPFGSLLHQEDYIIGGHALVNPSHIIDGRICTDEKLTISDEKYTELTPYHLQKHDVVMGRRGEMGRCAVVDSDGLLCGTGSLIIRSKGELKPDFIQKIISFPSYKKTIEDKAVGQTMPNLNVPIVSSFEIIKPPKEVQDNYYAFVQQIDKSKFAVQKSLEKTEILYKSLMQTYFG